MEVGLTSLFKRLNLVEKIMEEQIEVKVPFFKKEVKVIEKIKLSETIYLIRDENGLHFEDEKGIHLKVNEPFI